MNIPLFLEIKNEYTEHLTDILTPYIFEGLRSIYTQAKKYAVESGAEDKTLIIYQKLLQAVNDWNQTRINEETIRIKQLSNTSDYLDDLVKAVIRSNIILLTYSNTVSNIIGQSFYNTMTTSSFIHRCYTECAKDAHNNPYLFYDDVEPMDWKRNQIIIQNNIQKAISRAIRKILPISMILKEYLVNSVNIIQEPRVELIGATRHDAAMSLLKPDMMGFDNQIKQEPTVKSAEKNNNNNNNDTKLEKEVMEIINSENARSDKQKIQAIMNIDKILTSLEPNKQEKYQPVSDLYLVVKKFMTVVWEKCLETVLH